jgi:high-affinity iron transporter
MTFRFVLFIALLASALGVASSEENKNEKPRLLVHLLEYIAADYPGAVEAGKVKSPTEYAEQKEFSQKAKSTLLEISDLRTNRELRVGVDHLDELILSKASAEEVAKVAATIKNNVIKTAGIEVSPNVWPSRKRAHALFQKNCVSCHGNNGYGDGPAGKNLDPKPGNFHDAKMASVPPFQAYNTIRLGVPGTGMAEFPLLSDRDVWDLAFYVTSLRYDEENQKIPDKYSPTIDLKTVAVKSDDELARDYSGVNLAAIRTYEPRAEDANKFIQLAQQHLESVRTEALRGNYEEASRFALMAYLDGVEPVEPRLRSRDAAFMVELEVKMLDVRSAVDRKLSGEALMEKISLAKNGLEKAQGILSITESSPWVTFSVAAGIFLREAFEAILILITILGVLKSIGSKKAVLYVHAGWMAALGVGVLCWFSSGWLMAISGAQREVLEGTVSLFAVVVLLYFGFWLHRKTEIGKWRAFLNQMLESAVDDKSLFALFGISFMAVFREAFETVLFLRALLLEAEGQQSAVVLGVLISFVFVVILAALLLKFSARIPVRQLFDVSSLLMAILAFILIGKAVHSFQETGWMPITNIPVQLRADFVGLYPTYETILPQVLVVVLAVGFWFYGRKPQTHHQQTA